MDYYGTVDGFLEYCQANGYDVSDLDPSPPDEIQTILLRGSVYIDGTYRTRFPGRRVAGRAQDREWPRIGATDTSGEIIPMDEVPIEIEQATYEAALREHDSPGSLSPDYNATERIKSESVGPLSVTYAVSDTRSSASDAIPVVPIIEMILAPLLGDVKPQVLLFGEVTR